LEYKEYIGIPFKNRGRDKKTGLDCWGLVSVVLKDQYAIIVPELLDYSDCLNRDQTSKVIELNTPLVSGIKLDNPEEGCVVVLSSGGLSAHVGLVISKNMMLHTTKGVGACIEPLNSPRIKSRIKGYYRVNESYSTI